MEYIQTEIRRKGVIFVATGEVWATSQKIILRADGIGSCVVLAVYDIRENIGAVAHIMLPGKSPDERSGYNTKYAQDAIKDMLFKMRRLGCAGKCLEACMVGGGNVLKDKKDTLCGSILYSVGNILRDEGFKVVATAVGGTIRRSAFLDIEDRAVYYTEGDSGFRLLFKWEAACG